MRAARSAADRSSPHITGAEETEHYRQGRKIWLWGTSFISEFPASWPGLTRPSAPGSPTKIAKKRMPGSSPGMRVLFCRLRDRRDENPRRRVGRARTCAGLGDRRLAAGGRDL